jgi:peptidylamidoglycolate lyase
MDLQYKRTISGDFLRNPCCFYQVHGHLYVPDLGALVTTLDKDDNCLAKLGDGKGVDNKLETEARDKFATPPA